jgi:hypothetical protein
MRKIDTGKISAQPMTSFAKEFALVVAGRKSGETIEE